MKGPAKSKLVSGMYVHELDKRKLLSTLHVSNDDAESALSELSVKKSAPITNVPLRTEDLNRLRPA